MTFFKWSKTAANNGTADSTCPFPEGMAASALNDGTRGMMAAAAKYRDDISGATVTGGTLTAYTLGTNEVFDTLLNLNTQMVAFTPHATNGATVTLNVDGLGAKPLRSAPGVELLAGTLILGTPYVAVYNNSDAVFYLQGFYGNPYSIPLLGGLDYWDTITPNSGFIFPAGQAISRITYAAAFARWGTTYGVGDGSTTFNVPDKTGRVSAMKEAAASRLTSTYFVGNSTVLGATGGNEKETIGSGNLPANIPNTLGATFTPNGGSQTVYVGTAAPAPTNLTGGSFANMSVTPTAITLGGSVAITGAINGSSANTPLVTVQPTIVCNYIIRIV